jgi:hypothetical protein
MHHSRHAKLHEYKTKRVYANTRTFIILQRHLQLSPRRRRGYPRFTSLNLGLHRRSNYPPPSCRRRLTPWLEWQHSIINTASRLRVD